MEFSLEVPDEPFWDKPSLQPPQQHLVNQATVNRPDNSPDQDPSAGPNISNPEAPLAHYHLIARSQQGIIQNPQNPSQVPRIDPSESVHDSNEKVIARIERLWVGRSDPFARYPIKMNSRALELIDHGQYPTRESLNSSGHKYFS